MLRSAALARARAVEQRSQAAADGLLREALLEARLAHLALTVAAQRRALIDEQWSPPALQNLALSEQSGQPHWDAELYGVKGDILLAGDGANVEEAEALFRLSLATGASQQAKMLELRAATRLCGLLEETGRADAARSTLAEVYDWFEEGFELPDLVAARTLLDRPGRA